MTSWIMYSSFIPHFGQVTLNLYAYDAGSCQLSLHVFPEIFSAHLQEISPVESLEHHERFCPTIRNYESPEPVRVDKNLVRSFLDSPDN